MGSLSRSIAAELRPARSKPRRTRRGSLRARDGARFDRAVRIRPNGCKGAGPRAGRGPDERNTVSSRDRAEDGAPTADIRAGRLQPDAYARNFADLHPPLDRNEARVAA